MLFFATIAIEFFHSAHILTGAIMCVILVIHNKLCKGYFMKSNKLVIKNKKDLNIVRLVETIAKKNNHIYKEDDDKSIISQFVNHVRQNRIDKLRTSLYTVDFEKLAKRYLRTTNGDAAYQHARTTEDMSSLSIQCNTLHLPIIGRNNEVKLKPYHAVHYKISNDIFEQLKNDDNEMSVDKAKYLREYVLSLIKKDCVMLFDDENGKINLSPVSDEQKQSIVAAGGYPTYCLQKEKRKLSIMSGAMDTIASGFILDNIKDSGIDVQFVEVPSRKNKHNRLNTNEEKSYNVKVVDTHSTLPDKNHLDEKECCFVEKDDIEDNITR